MDSIAISGYTEMMILHRARLKNGYKNLTIGQAYKELVKAQSRKIDRLIREELNGIRIWR